MSGLTFDILSEILDRLRLKLAIVYAVNDIVPADQVLQIAESETHYACFVFHSEAEAQAMATATGLALLHVRDAPAKTIKWIGGLGE